MAGVLVLDFDGTVLDTESGEFEEWRAAFGVDFEVICEPLGESETRVVARKR